MRGRGGACVCAASRGSSGASDPVHGTGARAGARDLDRSPRSDASAHADRRAIRVPPARSARDRVRAGRRRGMRSGRGALRDLAPGSPLVGGRAAVRFSGPDLQGRAPRPHDVGAVLPAGEWDQLPENEFDTIDLAIRKSITRRRPPRAGRCPAEPPICVDGKFSGRRLTSSRRRRGGVERRPSPAADMGPRPSICPGRVRRDPPSPSGPTGAPGGIHEMGAVQPTVGRLRNVLDRRAPLRLGDERGDGRSGAQRSGE